jgi:hypothetical protein
VPPQHSTPTIGDALSAHGVSWGYFGEGFDRGHPGPNYCGICDPMQYASAIMTDPAKRANIEHGLDDFDSEATAGTLPAVTFLKPGDDDGHPGYSTLAAFEEFTTHAIDEVQNNPRLWANTAILVTFDEGGGYYDSGYVQPVSFFGDGTRVPMVCLAVRQAGVRQPRLHRSRVGAQVHRAQLEALAAVIAQLGQPSRSGEQPSRPVRAGQQAGDRGHVRLLRLPCRSRGGAAAEPSAWGRPAHERTSDARDRPEPLIR